VPEIELSVLLDRCGTGDELAWEALVRRFQARAYGIAYHYLANAEDARDLAQEVFVRIYKNLRSDIDANKFVPWMVRITRNLCVDHLRRRRARPHGSQVNLDEIERLPSAGRNPEQQWTDNARKRLIYSALQQLTALNREIILLKEIQGLQMEEIATMLGVPLGTIKSRSNRARIELAQKLVALDSEQVGETVM